MANGVLKVRKVQKVQFLYTGLLIALLILAVGDVAEIVALEPFFEGAFAHVQLGGDFQTFGGGEGDGKFQVDFLLFFVEFIDGIEVEFLPGFQAAGGEVVAQINAAFD